MSKYNILIVEDELIPANYIKQILEQAGHSVLGIADSSQEALSYLNAKNYPELILMDIRIKGELDGIEVAKYFQKSIDVAVLYISAFNDDSLLQRAHTTHPIGYLVKPIQEKTLLSTVAVGMSNYKSRHSDDNIMLTKTIMFNPKKQLIIDQNKSSKLTKNESLILGMLIKYKNQIIPYDTLENSVWTEKPPSDTSLRTTIWRLKKKLPQSVKINNLYGSGYILDF